MFNLNQIIMKSRKLLLGLAFIALAFVSCKDDRQERAQRNVDTYSTYVDSIGNLPPDEARTNWSSIDAAYQTRTNEVDAAVVNVRDREKSQERINASKSKYNAMKAKMESDMQSERTASTTTGTTDTYGTTGTQQETTGTQMERNRMAGNQPNASKQMLRNSLFKAGKVGTDMNFNWVNKDNIHSVYQHFVSTVENNKDKYTRQDWDEIKLLYEALDTRKNTVEKEGLSADDNRKIAALKVKFAPMYTVNRLSAKSEENEAAKEK